MSKPLGGRGKKAPYKTVMVRTPEPAKPQVEALIEQFRKEFFGEDSSTEISNSQSEIEQCLKLVDRFIVESGQSDKMHTRNNVNLSRFRDWLRAQNSRAESDTL